MKLHILIILAFILAGCVESPSYHDEESNVMYFYYEGCSYCQKQRLILEELAQEGLRVHAINIEKNPEYVHIHDVRGVPAFISKNGQRLEGYQEKASLREFLQQHA